MVVLRWSGIKVPSFESFLVMSLVKVKVGQVYNSYQDAFLTPLALHDNNITAGNIFMLKYLNYSVSSAWV